MKYVAPPTLAKFHASDAFGRFVMGPVGSGKTTGMIMELLRRAAQQAPSPDGKRRTRMAIVRNTLQQLRTTVLVDVQQLLQPIVNFYVSEQTIKIRTNEIESDWLLIPLEEVQDQRRLLSTQLTCVWFNEFREIDQNFVAAAAGRVGRFPSKAMVPGGATWFGLIGDSNPFAEGSAWHKFLVLERPPEFEFYRQPSGVSPEAENVENLPPGYYQRLLESHDEAWATVHVHGEFGEDVSGQAVFKNAYSEKAHAVPGGRLLVNPHAPLLVLQDFGRTPTSLITQVDPFGRWNIFKEVTSEDMGLNGFLDSKLKPLLMAEPYAGKRVLVVADPAGAQKSQVNEESPFEVLKAKGFMATKAPTNDLAPRLNAAESILLQRRGETAAVQIDREGCPLLLKALAFEYRYKRKKDGTVNDEPEKRHPWSDLADCFQYGAMSVNTDLPGRVLARVNRVVVPSGPPFSARAWT